jgi:hypothetical protein
MSHKQLLLLFAFLATPSFILAGDEYIGSWINSVLATLGVSVLDPINLFNPLIIPSIFKLKPSSLDNVVRYLNFSYAAYCSANLETWTCDPCQGLGPNVHFISVIENPAYDTKGFFAVDDSRQEIILTFRGTFNIPNLAMDLNLLQVNPTDNPLSPIRVASGFLSMTQSLYPQVIGALTNITTTYPTYKVVLTGHSLGGAQAAHTLFLFKQNDVFLDKAFELYTYGQPRLGNIAFANYINALPIPVARVTNRADIFPHLAYPAILNYIHYGNEVFIKDGLVRNCSNVRYEDPTCSNSQGPVYSALDHFSYFGADWTLCITQDPINFALQLLLNLHSLIPSDLVEALRAQVPDFSEPLSNIVQQLFPLLGK